MNPAAREVGPLFTLFLLTESHRRPSLFLGASSDRIGSPSRTQSYYLTCAKQIPHTSLAPYVSLNYSEWDQGFNVPFGLNVQIHPRWSLRPMYDGDRSHLTITHHYKNYSASLLWVWFERLGFALSAGF